MVSKWRIVICLLRSSVPTHSGGSSVCAGVSSGNPPVCVTIAVSDLLIDAT
jgi:hypothetical protein